jgi:hypothetical protein
VGQGDVDYAYWGYTEDMTMSKLAYKINTSKPGELHFKHGGADTKTHDQHCLIDCMYIYTFSGYSITMQRRTMC